MKVIRVVSAFFLGITITGLAPSSAQALTLFEDNFNSESAGNGKNALTKWDVTVGTVDVYTPYSGQGFSLDMEGTPGNGRIETKENFSLAAGQYQLSFKLGNNSFSGNSLLVQLGSVFSETFSSTSTLTSITRSITISAPK